MRYVVIVPFLLSCLACDRTPSSSEKNASMQSEIAALRSRIERLESEVSRAEKVIPKIEKEEKARARLEVPKPELAQVESKASGVSATAPITPVRWKFDGTEETDPTLGKSSAPLLFMIFTDFESKRYKDFAKATLPAIRSKYVDSGKAQIIVRDFPLASHTQAKTMAKLANCAATQDLYWQAHDALLFYGSVAGRDPAAALAARLGAVDREALAECYAAADTTIEVEQDSISAKALGVTGVPAIAVLKRSDTEMHGVLIRGAQPLAVIEQEIAKLQ